MSQLIEVKVPDIGDFDEVPVIELFVKAGDTIAEEDPICTLESDKATMDVPSSAAGVIKEVLIKVGDKVAEGSVLLKVESADAPAREEPKAAAAEKPAPAPDAGKAAPAPDAAKAAAPAARPAAGGTVQVKVPDIGDFDEVPVIEMFVQVGDTLKEEDAICTLESDKATMDVPSSATGTVRKVLVKVGDKVGEGSVLLEVESEASDATPAEKAAPAPAERAAPAPQPAAAEQSAPAPQSAPQPAAAESPAASSPTPVKLGGTVHASPSVRGYARELGVDLTQVK